VGGLQFVVSALQFVFLRLDLGGDAGGLRDVVLCFLLLPV
jgi:hypothetical protein